MRIALGIALVLIASATIAEAKSTRLIGDLPRKDKAPFEAVEGVDSVYGVLEAPQGARLRTIVTRPEGSRGRLPAVLFVHWLSCDTVELPASLQNGWSQMMRRVIRESGMLVMRTETSGVGDSKGVPCAQLDYDTQLAYHRAALGALRRNEQVDPDRIVVFGASIGATYAPLLAAGQKLAGVLVWGGGARTWFERQLAFDRRALELGGTPLGESGARMHQLAPVEAQYLLEGRTPQQIAAADPDLGKVWHMIVGTGENDQYGRPFAFHQQAQRQDWAAAWAKVNAPVLALHGEYDWYESRESVELIARIVNSVHPGSGEFREVPGINHHFDRFTDAAAAFRDTQGRPDPDQAVELMLAFLKRVAAAH